MQIEVESIWKKKQKKCDYDVDIYSKSVKKLNRCVLLSTKILGSLLN